MTSEKKTAEYSVEKELLRWGNFFTAWTKPEPEVNQTPREAIWRKNKATVWYYKAPVKKYDVPLFLVYSLVNQPFILDLAEGNSMIEAYIQNGFDVYLLDCGKPGYEDKEMTADDFITEYIQRGVQRALRHSGAEDITVVGYCLGGTIAAMYAAIAEEPIRNLVLTVSPIDFKTVPFFDQWANVLRRGEVSFDELFDAIGLLPARSIKAGMRMVTNPIYYSPYLSLLNKAYSEEYIQKWKRINKWTNGHIPFTAACMKQLMNDLGKYNKLADGGLIIAGKKAELSNITANLLVVSTDLDRLVLKDQNIRVADLVSSEDKTFTVVNGGHTTLATNGELPSFLADWLPERSKPLENGHAAGDTE
ncbi:alpha/beta fold hydrolase [Metabacillus sp. GX 13764]|uniref:alpha/beta fold hydrolase n=1 Tax=Metabacillus kandeliae TaxID=2900151 RepID=UPI001E42C0AE|nr:alpha/beta fold hydrolase [Metabacillus kandeliae]MCD7032728.1 alpha/beta fold hydrolase [Metabacillus kandeliae]